MKLYTKTNYQLTKRAARRLILPSLEGDGRYLAQGQNLTALKNRIVGWIMAQPWYAHYERWSDLNASRDDVSLLAAELANDVAIDVASGNPKFL